MEVTASLDHAVASDSTETDMTPSAFLILLALADEPRHGLGIVEEVERRTRGQVKLGPGTLYGTVKKLREEGLIEEPLSPPDPEDDDPRRRYYQLTRRGRRAARREAAHLRVLMDAAMDKALLPKGAQG